VAAAAVALDAKAAALEGEPTPILEEPKTVSFSAMNDTLTALMALVDGADFAPSEESFAAYQRTCKALNAALASWKELKTKNLPALSATLSQSKLPPVPEYPEVGILADCGN